ANAHLASNQDIEALVAAIKLGQQVRSKNHLEPDIKAIARNTLQQVIYGAKEQNRLEGHNDYVRGASFSPDGKIIATASDDKTVKLWQRDGCLIRSIKTNTYLRSVHFSPDGKTIALAGMDRTVQLWNIDGQRLKTLKGHQDMVTHVEFSPDGKTLASASVDNTVRLWSLDGKPLHTLKGHTTFVNQVSFHPSGSQLATVSHDRTIKLWKSDGTLVRTLEGHRGEVFAVSFSPDGKILASASNDRTIKLWNLDGTLIRTLKGHSGAVFTLKFSPDGKFLVSGGDATDKTIKLWKLDGTLLRTLEGHSDWISSLNFSPDGRSLLSTSADGMAKFWQIHSPLIASLKSDDEGLYDLRSSAASSLILMFGINGKVTLAKPDGTPIKILAANSQISAFEIAPGSGLLAGATADGQVMLWQPDGTLVKTFAIGKPAYNLEFSQDGKTLATLSQADNILRLWTVQGQLIQAFPGPNEWNWATISPDLTQVLTNEGFSNQSRVVKLWSQDGKLITTFKGHQGDIISYRFSEDGQTIGTTSFDKTAKLWSVDGKLLTTLKGHSAAVLGLAFRPDGQQIVTASEDHTIKIWQRDGTLITTLRTEGRPINPRFTPDGKALSYIVNNTPYLWNIAELNSMETLMAQGCTLLQNYLVSHPNQLLELETCQNSTNLVTAGRTLAKREDIPNAVDLLRKARQQDSNLNFDPEQEANTIANQGKAQRLVEAGQELALADQMPEAVAKFQEALHLDPHLTLNPTPEAQQWKNQGKATRAMEEGISLSQKGQLAPVVQKFRQAVQLDSTLGIEPETAARQFVAFNLKEQATPLVQQGKIAEAIALTQRAESVLSREFHNLYFPDNWDMLCWGGGLWNQADRVMAFCDKAVAVAPKNGQYRDSRGLARALKGNVAGAIADFQYYIEWAENDEYGAQRQRWIKALQAGENPFTSEELTKIRNKQL
ncbi:MAG: hypothetical protein VKJ24_03065, partial [Synechococcales bacterium]|nr:hypothetical protein [Synechococcales bacterium]